MADTPETRLSGSDARQQAGQLADLAKQRGKGMLAQQKDNAAHHLGGLANALRQTANKCAEQPDQRTTGRTLEQAAAGLEKVADSLRSRDLDGLIDQATDLVRRQPAVFIAGTIAAGFLLSRFAKSSSSRPHSAERPRDRMASPRSREEGSSTSYTTGRGSDSAPGLGGEPSYVTSAHANPDEVARGYSAVPPVTPTGRRDF